MCRLLRAVLQDLQVPSRNPRLITNSSSNLKMMRSMLSSIITPLVMYTMNITMSSDPLIPSQILELHHGLNAEDQGAPALPRSSINSSIRNRTRAGHIFQRTPQLLGVQLRPMTHTVLTRSRGTLLSLQLAALTSPPSTQTPWPHRNLF